MRYNLSAFLLIFLSICSCTEEEVKPKTITDEEFPTEDYAIYGCIACDNAMPKEGMAEFYDKLISSIERPNACYSGKIYVGLIINEVGHMRVEKVWKGIDSTLDSAVVEALRSMESGWKPAVCNGVPMSMRMIMPIKLGE